MSSIFNKNYISTTYEDKKTDYPLTLCKYLFKNFSNKKVLDVGCGNGEVTKNLLSLGLDAYGIDFSEAAKDSLGPKFNKVNFQKDNFPFDDNTFDIVFSKSVIEHLEEPDILIKESYRVLKPGGIIITMTPSWKHNFREQFYIDHTHVTPFTRYSLETIHKLELFQEVKCDYFYQLPISWKYPVIKFLFKIIQIFQVPYRPFENINWPNSLNKFFRFSQEAMLICIGKK